MDTVIVVTYLSNWAPYERHVAGVFANEDAVRHWLAALPCEPEQTMGGTWWARLRVDDDDPSHEVTVAPQFGFRSRTHAKNVSLEIRAMGFTITLTPVQS